MGLQRVGHDLATKQLSKFQYALKKKKKKSQAEINLIHERDIFVQASILKFYSLLLIHLNLITLLGFREEDYQTN